MRKLSEAQIWLVDWLHEKFSQEHRVVEVLFEHRFCERLWRFDVAIPSKKVGIEIEGGLFLPARGRHVRGAGIRNDIEKYNTATALGWKVFRFLPEQILKGQAKEFLEKYL